MVDLKKYIVNENTSILNTMKVINNNSCGNAFVCEGERLLATVSDGDIRRSIIKGISGDETVDKIANYSPKYLYWKERNRAEQLLQEEGISVIPIVDESLRLIDIQFTIKKKRAKRDKIDKPVVIMAGGKGNRLKPFTNVLPKPLIPIGDSTIMERIIYKFREFGCSDFTAIINYKKNLIKSYFADKEEKTDLRFIEEGEFLGTGGGLSLIKNIINTTFFITNCDIIVEADYNDILNQHIKSKSIITVVCAKKNITMPYGVIKMNEEGYMDSLEEKPVMNFMTNTGLYLVEPEFLDYIMENMCINITDIIQSCLDKKEKVGVYAIDEECWMDMGQLEELEKMKHKLGV